MTHQLLNEIVGHPELLQSVSHRLHVLNLFEKVSPERQDLEVVQPREASYLVDVVRGQSEVPAAALSS